MSRMWTPRRVGSLVACVAALVTASDAAELRMSAHGQPVVRRATYQVTDDIGPTVPQATELVMEPTLADPHVPLVDTGCDEAWDVSCGVPVCGWNCWGSLEFLLWWRRGEDMPPLVTTSPAGTPVTQAGVLGFPDTEILFPTESQNGDARPGGRLTLGVWMDPCQSLGIGGRLYTLGETTANHAVTTESIPILARPFFNLTLSQDDADVVGFPSLTTGGIAVRNLTKVSGGDVFLRRLLLPLDDCRRIDLIGGYQFAAIDSELLIASTRTSIGTGGSIPFGTVLDQADLFDTTNRYHAGTIGLLAEYDRCEITWSLLAKVGLGNMKQRTEIAGRTQTAIPGQAVILQDQGLLALDTNTGVYDRNVFAVSPEVQLTAAYHLNECIDLTVGYSFIYWNRVAQAGTQIDPVLNTSQINGTLTGDPRPAFLGQDGGFLVQGLSFGVQCVW